MDNRREFVRQGGWGVSLCRDCGYPLPRRTKQLWMVTWDGKDEPPYWREDVPCYYTTRRDAKAYRDELEMDPDYDGPPLIVKVADDATYDDIVWHYGCMA